MIVLLRGNAKVEQYGSTVESSPALSDEDEASYGPFAWVRNTKIGNSMVP